MDENKLYPLKFKPIIKDLIWGGNKLGSVLGKKVKPDTKAGESWEISGVQGNLSVVSEGWLKGNNIEEIVEIYMGDLVGEKVYDRFGVEFPLLIKFIDAADDLSIQVHPDDELAKERHNAYGKTEMWYVMDAESNSKLIVGFNQEMDADKYQDAIAAGNLPEYMNFEEVKEGSVFFMPAGRVHAIGKGILLAEIQQCSHITYRLFDWNRKDKNGKGRELHTELALDAIDFSNTDSYQTDYKKPTEGQAILADCPYFHTNLLCTKTQLNRVYYNLDSFVIYMCTKGEAEIITITDKQSTKLQKGEVCLLPAIFKDVDIKSIGTEELNLLEIYIP